MYFKNITILKHLLKFLHVGWLVDFEASKSSHQHLYLLILILQLISEKYEGFIKLLKTFSIPFGKMN